MSRLRIPPSESDHARGPANATVTLVEYGDFECPYCGRAFWVLKNLERKYRRDLRFVYRHFPLTEIHPHALLAAEAAEAVAARGKFWEMHDTLFENQDALEPTNLIEYAREIGVDELDELMADLQKHRYRDRVHDQFMGGVRSGVNGTPCLFINGDRYEGYVEEGSLSLALDAARSGLQLDKYLR